jgi:hypothetical protein
LKTFAHEFPITNNLFWFFSLKHSAQTEELPKTIRFAHGNDPPIAITIMTNPNVYRDTPLSDGFLA